jgi:hypothetical protein
MFSLVGVGLDLLLFRRLVVSVKRGQEGVLAGERLDGSVDLTLEKVVNTTGLKIVVSGYEEMAWAETDSDGDTTNYSSKIEHLHIEHEIHHLSTYLTQPSSPLALAIASTSSYLRNSMHSTASNSIAGRISHDANHHHARARITGNDSSSSNNNTTTLTDIDHHSANQSIACISNTNNDNEDHHHHHQQYEQLVIGTYSIPFSFELPESLLPSYRAQYSRMVYEIRATVMIRSWVAPNIRTQYEFRVLGTPISTWRSITARTFPGAAQTLRESFWFDNGHILLRVETCKVLYIPGERLALHVVVDNQSTFDVRAIRIHLRRDVHESGTDQGVSKTVDRRQSIGIRDWSWPIASGKTMTRDLVYNVPSGVVATLLGRLLRVSYRLIVELLHPLRLSTKCEIPIMIAPKKLLCIPEAASHACAKL